MSAARAANLDTRTALRRRIATALVALGMCLPAATGCAGGQQFRLQAEQGPAARAHGSVQVEAIQGGQCLVLVEVQDLPPPERVASGQRYYAVWLQHEQASPSLIGTLDYNRGLRSGNLLAVSEHSKFTLHITAESNNAPGNPSGLLVTERRIGGR